MVRFTLHLIKLDEVPYLVSTPVAASSGDSVEVGYVRLEMYSLRQKRVRGKKLSKTSLRIAAGLK